ncbi:GNAT family N-acetyltransferase [Clostridium sp. YIM B02515]|uniref:GNAT family N-acetyltransferase n=1 Tax=Clostridium rhizosphaerae TaxID=2803861 RepID=A0ABS1T5Z8_9CLOT|nr:GNAT family N-acetyltransferase [Clostridium rhizosphaerae]MBL4934768.1 GNAT family N-acetyltransferase [Clostridium rhizosphaerae]
MRFTGLETERLILRKFCETDFSIVYDWLGNSENMKYRKMTLSEEEAHKYLEWAISNANEEECRNFEFATVLKETGTLIGAASLFGLDDEPELGWTIHRNYWRQGFGTEIAKELLKFGFQTLGLRRIIAGCNSNNTASYRIMEKIGMRREAHFIKAQRVNSIFADEWCDRFQYAILYEEWLNSST